MVSRLFIALFYAVVFFALGAWSGGSLHKIGEVIAQYGVGAGPTVSPGSKPAPASPAADAKADSAVKPVAPAEAAAPVKAPATMPPPDLGPARTAFATGDLSGSVAAYLAVLATHPTDADALGELGNVYFNAGQSEKAAQMYMAAAQALLTAGDTARARALLPAIRPYAPDLAKALEAQLVAAGPGK